MLLLIFFLVQHWAIIAVNQDERDCEIEIENAYGSEIECESERKNLIKITSSPFDEKMFLFSRGHATLHLAVSVRPSVRSSVPPIITFLNYCRFCLFLWGFKSV